VQRRQEHRDLFPSTKQRFPGYLIRARYGGGETKKEAQSSTDKLCLLQNSGSLLPGPHAIQRGRVKTEVKSIVTVCPLQNSDFLATWAVLDTGGGARHQRWDRVQPSDLAEKGSARQQAEPSRRRGDGAAWQVCRRRAGATQRTKCQASCRERIRWHEQGTTLARIRDTSKRGHAPKREHEKNRGGRPPPPLRSV